jgi:hypothetical protein
MRRARAVGVVVAGMAWAAIGSGPAVPVAAQESDGGDARPVVRAERATGPIRIDGVLDDAAWQSATVVSDFTQVDPLEGRPVSQPTEVRILYDDEALYIGARLHDDGPVTSRLGRRDMALFDADWFGVVIDAYHDHRTGFVFDVNPAGVQRDAIKSVTGGGGEQDDNSWDAVWQVATSVDEGGWTAEYRIPFSQLRFSGTAEEHRWGLQLERIIGRNREYAVTSFTPKSEPGGIPTYGHLEGIRDIVPGNRLELLPYVLTRGEFVDPGANPYRTDREGSLEAGLDLRYRVTSELTLNASINPDFGQVEVDPAVVNLTVYETRFDEKRPFFIEGSEIFDFGRNTSGGQLFYSRRIGRAPQLGAPTPFADAPDVTRIWGAGKFSGKTASGWSFGVIEALTSKETARYRTDQGGEAEAVVEPMTNYLVARARRDLRAGRSSVGAMLTAVSRELSDERTREVLRSGGYAGGLDFRHETDDRDWVVRGSAALSHIRGEPTSIARVQRAGNHFFQRPDAEHLEVDTDATSMTGYSVGAAVERQGGEHWRGELAVAATSPRFEVNDLGFQTRTDRRDVQAGVTYLQNRPGSFFRNYSLSGTSRYEHNYDWQRILAIWALSGNFRHLDFWGGHFRIGRNLPALDDRSTRGGPLMERPGNWNGFFAVSSDGRKAVTLGGHVMAAWDDYDGWERTLGLSLGLKPSPRWNLALSPRITRGLSSAQYVGTLPDATAADTYGARYLFAPLEQTTLSLETRLNLTFTPRLSLELYTQPFLSSGDYGEVGSLIAPQAYEFEPWDGATPDLDFNLRSLRGNAVLRWEWRPGSTLYLAWQQTRSDFAREPGVGEFDWGRDRQALFRAQPDNIFLLKVNYWFTP